MATPKKENRKEVNHFLRQRNPGLNSRIQDYWIRNNKTQGNRMSQNKMEDNEENSN